MLLKYFITSSFLIQNFKSYQGKESCGNIFVFFPHLHDIGQLVVHPPSRIVSHPKDKKFL